MRKLYWIGWAFLALSASMAAGHFRSASISGPAGPEALAIEASAGPGAARALEWFQAMRPHCNAVDVETRHRRSPPPLGWSGAGYSAACYALAGRVDRARWILRRLSGDERRRATGIVFGAAHPTADAGDDLAVGPIMELVVEFRPDHHMALYHAGVARYETGDHETARDYLRRFLERYDREDGRTRRARAVLES